MRALASRSGIIFQHFIFARASQRPRACRGLGVLSIFFLAVAPAAGVALPSTGGEARRFVRERERLVRREPPAASGFGADTAASNAPGTAGARPAAGASAAAAKAAAATVQSYQHFRLDVKSSTDGSQSCLDEVQFRDARGLIVEVIASNTSNETAQSSFKLYDSNLGKDEVQAEWCTSAPAYWVDFTLKYPINATSYSIWARNGAPRTWALLARADGNQFQSLDVRSNVMHWRRGWANNFMLGVAVPGAAPAASASTEAAGPGVHLAGGTPLVASKEKGGTNAGGKEATNHTVKAVVKVGETVAEQTGEQAGATAAAVGKSVTEVAEAAAGAAKKADGSPTDMEAAATHAAIAVGVSPAVIGKVAADIAKEANASSANVTAAAGIAAAKAAEAAGATEENVAKAATEAAQSTNGSADEVAAAIGEATAVVSMARGASSEVATEVAARAAAEATKATNASVADVAKAAIVAATKAADFTGSPPEIIARAAGDAEGITAAGASPSEAGKAAAEAVRAANGSQSEAAHVAGEWAGEVATSVGSSAGDVGKAAAEAAAREGRSQDEVAAVAGKAAARVALAAGETPAEVGAVAAKAARAANGTDAIVAKASGAAAAEAAAETKTSRVEAAADAAATALGGLSNDAGRAAADAVREAGGSQAEAASAAGAAASKRATMKGKSPAEVGKMAAEAAREAGASAGEIAKAAGQAAAKAAVATVARRVEEGEQVAPKLTATGCECRENWTFEASTCINYCCNPGDHPGGDWCLVVDPSVCGANRTWDWCTRGTLETTQGDGQGNATSEKGQGEVKREERQEASDEEEVEDTNGEADTACGHRVAEVDFAGGHLTALYAGRFRVKATRIFRLAQGQGPGQGLRTLIDAAARDDALRTSTAVSSEHMKDWDGKATIEFETTFTDGCIESKTTACSVIDGSATSAAYPCACGNSTCSEHALCSSSTSTCHAKYATIEECLDWQSGECKEFEATRGKLCSEASCCGSTTARNYLSSGTCHCINKCNEFFGGEKPSAIYCVRTDDRVYRQVLSTMSPLTEWALTSKGDVTSIAVDGGIIYGVGIDHAIRRQSLSSMRTSSDWVLISKSGVTSIAIRGDTIYGVGLSGDIWKQTLSTMTTATEWKRASRGNVKSIALAGDMVYAVGADHSVRKQHVHTMSLTSDWIEASKGDVVSVAINGDTIYGVGTASFGGNVMKQRLSTMSTYTDWVVASSGSVVALAIPQATLPFQGRLLSIAMPSLWNEEAEVVSELGSNASAAAALNLAAAALNLAERLAGLANNNSGCHTLREEAACTAAKDGRTGQSFSESPCQWCCGDACTKHSDVRCEPKSFLLSQPSYVGHGKTGLGEDTCGPSHTMNHYDLPSDASLACASSSCTCADTGHTHTLGTDLHKCKNRCLESPNCTVIFCEGKSTELCDCHEYSTCNSTRTPPQSGVHFRKARALPPCAWAANNTACPEFEIGKFVVGMLGATACPYGLAIVQDDALCKSAAKSAGFPWAEGDNASKAGGCNWCASCDTQAFRSSSSKTELSKFICYTPDTTASPTPEPTPSPSEEPTMALTEAPTRAPTESPRACHNYGNKQDCPEYCSWSGGLCAWKRMKTTNGQCTLVATNKEDPCCDTNGITPGASHGARWPCVMKSGGCQGGSQRGFQDWVDHCHQVHSANPDLFDDRICVSTMTFKYDCVETNLTRHGEEADWLTNRIDGSGGIPKSASVLTTTANECPSGMYRLTSARACQAVAPGAGYAYAGTRVISNAPTGCMVSDGSDGQYPKGAYMNTHSRGGRTDGFYLICGKVVWGKWTSTRTHASEGGTQVDSFCGRSTDSFTISCRPSPSCAGDPFGNAEAHVVVNQNGFVVTDPWHCCPQGNQGNILFNGAPQFALDSSCEPDKHFVYASYGPAVQKECCEASGTKYFLDLFHDGKKGRSVTSMQCRDACAADGSCMFYAQSPTSEMSWCTGFSSCDRQCSVVMHRPHTIYSIRARYSVFATYEAQDAKTCCDVSGSKRALDLWYDGKKDRVVSTQHCYDSCRAHHDCKYFRQNPTEVEASCVGYQSCDYRCPTEKPVANTIYSMQAAVLANGCAPGYTLETRDASTSSGDICRMASWSCPVGCEYTPDMQAPFCLWTSTKKPCHGAAHAGTPGVPPYGCAAGYELETHETESLHGDTCRMMDWKCPIGCAFTQDKKAPFCLWEGTEHTCHVATKVDSMYTTSAAACQGESLRIIPGSHNGQTYRCRDGQCIDVKGRCNGVSNCQDASDEQDCEQLNGHRGQEGAPMWMTLYARGSYGRVTYNATVFNSLFREALSGIIRRECSGCAPSHRDIYIRWKRDPLLWDAYDSLIKTWRANSGVSASASASFDLYGTFEEALADTRPWTGCGNGGMRPGKGFPGECGPTHIVAGQWNSLTDPSGQANYRYSIVHQAPTPAPTMPRDCKAFDTAARCPSYCAWSARGAACTFLPQIPAQEKLNRHVVGCSASGRSEMCSTTYDGIANNDFYAVGMLGAWIKLTMDAEYVLTSVKFTQRTCCDACVVARGVTVKGNHEGSAQILGFTGSRRMVEADLTTGRNLGQPVRGTEFSFTAFSGLVAGSCTWGADEITLSGSGVGLTCAAMACPRGFTAKPEASHILCAGSICTEAHDRDTCCVLATRIKEAMWCNKSDEGVGNTFANGSMPKTWDFSSHSKHSLVAKGVIADFGSEEANVVEGVCAIKFNGQVFQVVAVTSDMAASSYGFSSDGVHWDTQRWGSSKDLVITAPSDARYFAAAFSGPAQACRQLSIIPLAGPLLPLGYACEGNRLYMGEATCIEGSCPAGKYPTQQACADACTALPACLVYMYDKHQRCYLKTGVGTRVDDPIHGTWSCAQVCPVGYRLSNIGRPEDTSLLQDGAYAGTVEDCAEMCDGDVDSMWAGTCRSFEWNPLTDKCNLYSELLGARDARSGYAFCSKDPHYFHTELR